MKQTYFPIMMTLLLGWQTIAAQNDKNWTTHLAYYEATGVAETNERVYVVANGSLYSYGKEDQEIILYSKQNGLSDTDIRLIRYNANTQTLMIVYSNGNIDLYDSDGFKNMPQLKNTTNVQSKNVNDIYFDKHLAYLSTDFGVVVVNLTKKEIVDAYKLNKIVNAVCLVNDTIIACTNDGLYKAATKDNLIDAGVWKKKWLSDETLNAGAITRMCYFKDHPVFFANKNRLYYETSDGEIKLLRSYSAFSDMTLQSDELLVCATDGYLFIFSDLTTPVFVKLNIANGVSSLRKDNKYWIASGAEGLLCIERNNDNQFETTVSGITINSPKRNYNTFMTIYDSRKLLIVGGHRYLARSWRPGTLMTYENDEWYNFDEMIVNRKTYEMFKEYTRDYLSIAVDPDDENHYFIATYGEGVIELKDNEFVTLHNADNSTLRSTTNIIDPETGIEKPNPNYVRVGSVCFDKDKNLWATNCLTEMALHVRKPTGEWIGLYYSPLNNADKIDKILITRNGYKWVNIPYDDSGIFVLDDKGTVDDTSDDHYHFFSAFYDGSRNLIPASEYLCMAEDRSDVIWIGTNIGILKCNNPSRALSDPNNLTCSRLTRDGDAYFLSGETVNAIAVDADNRKWIGTATQGVFVINEDGSETIYNFTTNNSPLLSNQINSIAINDKTGDVFIGTEKGLVSYKSDVISGKEPFSNVYAFPNPVRPEFIDKVTITGLTDNAHVKITDINGNLIYQGRAIGNQLVWNCRTHRGNRVATGVYLVLASTSDGSEGVVTKIAVVK
jgi:ligand-binding sensor domain-containing protein